MLTVLSIKGEREQTKYFHRYFEKSNNPCLLTENQSNVSYRTPTWRHVVIYLNINRSYRDRVGHISKAVDTHRCTALKIDWHLGHWQSHELLMHFKRTRGKGSSGVSNRDSDASTEKLVIGCCETSNCLWSFFLLITICNISWFW